MNRPTSNILFSHIFIFILILSSLTGCSRDENTPNTPKSPQTSSQSLIKDGSNASVRLASIDPAQEAVLEEMFITFSERGDSAAYRLKKNRKYQAVFNGKAGRFYTDIAHMNMSPDGSRFAYDILKDDGKRRMVVDGKEGPPYDDIWEPVFSPDGLHLAYTALIGDDKHYMIVDGNISEPSFYYGNAVFSADSSKIAYIDHAHGERKARLIVSDLKFKEQSFKECRDDGMVINSEKTMIAAVRMTGAKQRVISFSFSEPDIVHEGPLFDSIVDIKYVNNIVFSSDGASLMYTATRGGKHYIVLNGIEEELPEGVLRWPPVIRPDGKAAGMILVTKDGGIFYEAFIKDGRKGKRYDEAALLVYSPDGRKYAYCAKEEGRFFVVANGKEGPVFDMVLSPMFSPDAKFLVYRARKDGKRFVVVADAEGKVIRQHPGYEVVFETQFTADGKSVAYGVKDGQELWWKVEKL